MIDLTADSFYEYINNDSNEIVVVDFWADWCGPCRLLSPILDELDSEMENVRFAKVDVDANAELATELKVSSIPSVFVFKGGQEVARNIGAKPKVMIRKFIEDAI